MNVKVWMTAFEGATLAQLHALSRGKLRVVAGGTLVWEGPTTRMSLAKYLPIVTRIGVRAELPRPSGDGPEIRIDIPNEGDVVAEFVRNSGDAEALAPSKLPDEVGLLFLERGDGAGGTHTLWIPIKRVDG